MSVFIGGPVDVDALTVVGELGSGGQGRVRLVEAPGIFPGRLAFKEYDPETIASVRADVLDRLVALRASAGDDLRTLLAERAAWPLAAVRRGAELRGFLMPPAPPEYTVTLALSGDGQSRPLAMEFLLNPIEYMARVGLRVSERNRVGLLREFARMLAVLHGDRIVVGDLSPKNVLVTVDPPRCFLLDCDAVCVDGESVAPQVETPDWRLPEGEVLGTAAGDRYKFGLLVLRLLLSDQAARDPAELTAAMPLFADVADLAARSRRDPDARPDWAEWTAAFDAVLPHSNEIAPTPPQRPRPERWRVAAGGPLPGAAGGPAGATARPRAARSGTARWAVAAAALVAAVCVLLVYVGGRTDDGTRADGASTRVVPPPVAVPTTAATPSTGFSIEPPRDRVGMVRLAGTGDSTEVIEVAEFFDGYFQAVNDKDWDTLLALYDPDGVVDPAKPDSRASFTEAMSTTEDSDVELVQVDPRLDPVRARVTFTSNQAAGYGPKGRPDETCTRWDLTVQLTRQGGGYRLLRPTAAKHRPC
ncbi:hypothetical protein V1634_06290 [Plantactinospora veratri]|uniref:Protein kinase domain-containing protein n=1 Tax=Plantactinospora veratri TaxID=1436122 RepID=A0ABU7S935_9ACTN